MSVVQSTYTNEQITAWLRGLLTIAWADGDFDEHEKESIIAIAQNELAPEITIDSLEPISSEDLAAVLGKGTPLAENFLRTAVMVAIADGIYSICEDHLLHDLCKQLGEPENILNSLRHTLEQKEARETLEASRLPKNPSKTIDPLQPLRTWLDGLEIKDPALARFLCHTIPSQCPFERDITLFRKKIVHIPPLCKLNPLYDQLVFLRFRALSYLADECGEDISAYI